VRDRRCQAGALPFFYKKHELCVVLITSSTGSRWIVPKGQIEPRLSRQDVAQMEAAEEAGVVGAIELGHRGGHAD
jgi:8-oxo-dGTP pyrophosphatase MutT (NUDIX family)